MKDRKYVVSTKYNSISAGGEEKNDNEIEKTGDTGKDQESNTADKEQAEQETVEAAQ